MVRGRNGKRRLFVFMLWRKWARLALLGLGIATGQAAGSDRQRRNSFLPQLTAIAGVISTGNASVDAALQHAVSHHLQGWFTSSTQLYADAARVAPTNADCFMGAALAYNFQLSGCTEATRSLRTFLRLHREQGGCPCDLSLSALCAPSCSRCLYCVVEDMRCLQVLVR